MGWHALGRGAFSPVFGFLDLDMDMDMDTIYGVGICYGAGWNTE